MSVIVTDDGFVADGAGAAFVPLDRAGKGSSAIDLASSTDPNTLPEWILSTEIIRVHFPGFADGRGFTLARHLRLMGFAGRLRAQGHVLADQYAMARRVGFDEVEIDTDLAERQPESHWLARANWHEHDYQKRLRG